MSWWVKAFIPCFCLLLAACGFTPMYGSGATPAAHGLSGTLNDIELGNIPDYEGQYLRNALIDRFYGGGRPASPSYVLSLDPVEESITDLDITKSSDATRAQLKQDTRMILTDKTTGKKLLERRLLATTSYNILQSQFTTRVSEANARRNGLDDLARQIEMQLGLYFNRL